jgi:hypothetical protein
LTEAAFCDNIYLDEILNACRQVAAPPAMTGKSKKEGMLYGLQ